MLPIAMRSRSNLLSYLSSTFYIRSRTLSSVRSFEDVRAHMLLSEYNIT